MFYAFSDLNTSITPCNVMEILIATLISCSDVQSIIESVRADKYLRSDAKTEIVEILL